MIILDGLDELPKSNLLWLPRELPDHVRIILTTLTNGGYYNGLKVLSQGCCTDYIPVLVSLCCSMLGKCFKYLFYFADNI